MTREQLVLRALRELGVVGAGQQPSAEDARAINDEIGPVMSDLARRNIFVWGDPDQIDDAAAVHLAIILANSAARQFGVQQDELRRQMAEARLRELRFDFDAGDPIEALYY